MRQEMQEKRSSHTEGAHQANQVHPSSQRTEAVRFAQARNFSDRDSIWTIQGDLCGLQFTAAS